MATPDGAEPVKSFDGGGDTDGHGHDGKGEGGVGAHAAHEHVMAPNHKAEEADGEHGVDHGFVAEDRFAREDGEQLRAEAHGGQDGDVNLGMAEEPEEMLPQERRAAFVSGELAVDGDERNEKAGAGVTIEQEQDARREQNAKRE